MLKLLEDLRDSPVPAELGVAPASLARLVADANSELLRAKFGRTPSALDQEDKLDAYASWLESIALLASEDSEGIARSLYVAGSIREFLLRTRPSDDLLGGETIAFLGLVLVCASSSHPAIGAVLAQRYLRHALQDSENDPERLATLAVAALAGRRFVDAIRLERRSRRLAAEKDWRTHDPGAVALAEGLLFLARASASLSWGMLFGSQSVAEDALQGVNRRLENSGNVMPPLLVWLCTRWLRAAQQIWHHSALWQLKEKGLPLSYRRRLAATGVVQLWPEQFKALESGLLDAPQFVVALPTGSGKTVLAEFAIVHCLSGSGSERCWACYLVPTRALVSQVERELSHRLAAEEIAVRSALGGLENSAALADEIEELSSPRTVTVTTPEKFEAYYRVEPETFDGLAILVVDEAHLVDSPDRGPLLEYLVSRIRSQQPEARVILLSAAASNPEDLADWLGSSAGTFSTSSRLNRQDLAVAVRLRAPEPHIEHRYTHRGESRRTVLVPGGLVTASDLRLAETEERGKVRVAVDDAFQVTLRQKLQDEEWVDLKDVSSAVDHSRELAEALHRSNETTLIFCPTRIAAANQAKAMVDRLDALPPGSPSYVLAEVVRRYVGVDHPLPMFIEHGVAFHHASLPAMVQRLLEYALSEGWIRTLFTTTTLREGINLPAQNSIIAGEQRFDLRTERTRDMDVSDFVNMSGRAGRPHLDTQGLAVLVPNKLVNALLLGRKYFLYGPDALAVRSALGTLIEAIEQAREKQLTALSGRDQALLLSLYATGLRSDESLRSFFERTLLFAQTTFDSDNAADFCAAAFRSLETNIGADRLGLISKLGFGLEGSLAITDFVEENHRVLADPNISADFGDSTTRELLSLCSDGCSRIPELRVRQLASDELWASQSFVEVASDWIAGTPYAALAQNPFFRSGTRDAAQALSDAVDFFGELSQWLPWGLGAIQYAVSALGHEPSALVSHLPLYARFGVPSRIAALLSLVGVFDRDAAVELSRASPLTQPTLEQVETWYKQIDLDEVLGRDPRSSVLRRKVPDVNTAGLRFRRFEDARLRKFAPCVVVRENERYVAFSLDGERLAERGAASRLDRFAHRDEGLFGMIAQSGDRPLIFVIDELEH